MVINGDELVFIAAIFQKIMKSNIVDYKGGSVVIGMEQNMNIHKIR